jgi:hypothetical protein
MRIRKLGIISLYMMMTFFTGAFAYDDGFANAPTGTPQHPTLLNSYAVRPPWKIAGVDYPVGPHQTPTKNPSTINITGVEINTTSRTVYVKGDNIKLDGYDFSMGGGWSVIIGIYGTGTKDTISNCNFLLGPTQSSGALIGGNPVDLVVEYCILDQTGPGANIPGGSAWSIVSLGGSGSLTFEYNWFKNFPQHVLELGTNDTMKVIDKYNLIENGGLCPGAHLNYLQFGGGNFRPVSCEFNTTYQPHTNPTGGEGFQFYNNGSGSVVGTCAFNTMIYGPNGEGVVHVPGGAPYTGTTNVSVHDNYIDKKAGGSYFYPDCHIGTNDFYCGNRNLVDGSIVLAGWDSRCGVDQGLPACPAPTVVITKPANNATVNGNVTVAGTASQIIEVAGIAVSVDGGTYTTATGTTAWSFNLNALNLTNGTHTLRAKAWDPWKDTTLSAIITITVDHNLAVANPFKGSSLSSAVMHTSEIMILDMRGRMIQKLTGGNWDGKDMQGAQVKTGVYMYRYTSDGNTEWGKILKQN